MPPSPWSGPVRSVPLVLPLILLVGLEAPSRADRVSIGASLGFSEGEGGTDSVTSRSVFARLRVVGGLSLEAELGGAAIAATDDGTDSGCVECGRSPRLPGKLAAATARFDLISRGAARPHILVGGGVESYATINTDFVYGKREIGVGLDIRLTDGLHLGADVRTGSRELIGSHQSKDVAILLYTPPPLSEEATGYVAGRLTLAASF